MKLWRSLEGAGLLFVLAYSLVGQDNPGLTARELYYATPQANGAKEPVKSAPKKGTALPSERPARQSNSAPLGLKYRILKLNTSGTFVPVPPESSFHSYDRIRLQLESNKSGLLYVVQQGSDGSWGVLFPSPEIRDNNNRVAAFEPLIIPATQEFIFDEKPGIERVFVILSSQPQADLESLMRAVRGDAAHAKSTGLAQVAPDLQRTADQLHAEILSRNLVIRRPNPEETSAKELQAVYLVNISSGPSRVTAEINLRHE